MLLADDHAVLRDGLRLLLEAQHDIRVIADAANGRDAVRQVVKLCPDVVIMDIAMPELNGIEAIGHSGTSADFNAFVFYLPDQGITMSGAVNYMDGIACFSQLMQRALDILVK